MKKKGIPYKQMKKIRKFQKVDRTLLLQVLADLKKNDILTIADLKVKEGETSPPKKIYLRFHDPGYGKCRPVDRR